MSENQYVLEARNLVKSFPGVKALDNVSLKVRPGTVHALMGENGAGKSTLMKCIYGIYKPDEGEVFIDGEKVSIMSPRDAMDKGISMIHQELNPVKPQTAAENIFVGRIPYKKALGIKWVDYKYLNSEAQRIFDKLGIDINPKEKVQELSTAYCQLIEIAKAVSFGAKIIIMDEPTSSLTETEAEILFKIIDQLKKENVAIVYISHKIDEILRISDDITIMRDGKYVGSWAAKDMTTDSIVNKMVGREMSNRFPEKKHTPGETFLKIENFTSVNPHSFKDISFEVKRGEIFGIGGLVGSQRSELVEAIFGLRSLTEGKVSIDGKEVSIKKPIDAIKNGMALLTEERRVTGIIGVTYKKDDRVYIEIVDNGVGVPEQKLKNIVESMEEGSTKESHIGIHNIYKRLQLFFGADKIEMKMENINPGFKISISIPYLQNK